MPDQVCRRCGCTDDLGCSLDDHWVEPDLCSECASAMQVDRQAHELLRQMPREAVRPHMWSERGRRVA